MSFDGIFLHHLKQEFTPMLNGKLSRITEIGDLDFIFEIRAFGKTFKLLTCFSSDFARIHLTNRAYDGTQTPKAFTMFLRKHIEGYKLSALKTIGCDRIIEFEFMGFNNFQDLTKKYLICEVMGRYSNLILTDDEYKILDCLKHDGVGEFNRIILPNATYAYPKQEKVDAYNLSLEALEEHFKMITNAKEIMAKFEGVSMNLAYPVLLSKSPALTLYSALHNKVKPTTFINQKEQLDFYFTPFDFKVEKEYASLSILLEEFYYEKDKSAKIKLKSSDILSFVTRQIKKNENKLLKLQQEKTAALDCESYRIKGELLLSLPNLKEHESSVDVYNYYSNKIVTILLDPKHSIIDNSKRFYKKYQKMKTSLSYIDIQSKICEDEIAYFKILSSQIEHADMNDIAEITEELKSLKYTKSSMKRNNRKQKIKLLTYLVGEDSLIMVGKNNLQNDYLTNKLTKSNDLWFHVKDSPGSHVVLNKSLEEASEQDIRTAAMIAAFYSTARTSSSVAVNYTLARYIKKIPGKRNCFVSISHEKTIYIDPDEDYINSLKVVK